jgi:hypothetical protein
MRDIRLSRLITLILIVATLIFFISCGIPFFVNFDNDISITKDNPTDKEIEFTVTISARGLNKIQVDPDYDFVTTPSLKFFYVLSDSFSPEAAITKTSLTGNNEKYIIKEVKSYFSNNYKGSTGNGYPLIVPTFYIYTNESNKSHNFARSRQLLKNWDDSKEEGILVGTFFNETEGQFNGAPKMDYLLEVIGSQDLLLKLDGGKVELHKNGIKNFTAFNEQLFPSDDESLNSFIDNSKRDDQIFLNPLKGANTLYLHLWVAVYGGEGSFTNVYWSDLTYLGYFDLYN